MHMLQDAALAKNHALQRPCVHLAERCKACELQEPTTFASQHFCVGFCQAWLQSWEEGGLDNAPIAAKSCNLL
jgi:hypothetical protein